MKPEEEITDIHPEDDLIIKINNLKKSFEDLEVLRNINISLKRGENIVVIGKSGSGKSVLIKCIVRLIEADQGKLMVFGKEIKNLDQRSLNNLRRKIGFLFQSAALYDSMTVRENLEFPLRNINDISAEEKNSRVEESLKNVGLLDAINKMPADLSGGMRKRVGLARTLILKPEIVLYDEPTTGLDPVTSKEISHLILEMQHKYNISSIIITHDLACARITSDKVMVLKKGEFIAEGKYDELMHHPDQWVKDFFETN